MPAMAASSARPISRQIEAAALSLLAFARCQAVEPFLVLHAQEVRVEQLRSTEQHEQRSERRQHMTGIEMTGERASRDGSDRQRALRDETAHGEHPPLQLARRLSLPDRLRVSVEQ